MVDTAASVWTEIQAVFVMVRDARAASLSFVEREPIPVLVMLGAMVLAAFVTWLASGPQTAAAGASAAPRKKAASAAAPPPRAKAGKRDSVLAKARAACEAAFAMRSSKIGAALGEAKPTERVMEALAIFTDLTDGRGFKVAEAVAGKRFEKAGDLARAVAETAEAEIGSLETAPVADLKEAAAAWRRAGTVMLLVGAEAAISAFERATQIDPHDSDGYANLGHVLRRAGRTDPALQAYTRAANTAGQDPAHAAVAYSNMAAISMSQQDYTHAETYFKRGLQTAEMAQLAAIQAYNLRQLGLLEQNKRNAIGAEQYLRKALEMYEQIGDEEGQAATLRALGQLAYLRKDMIAARDLQTRALALNERLGNHSAAAASLLNLGMVEQVSGDLEAADAQYAKALAIAEAEDLQKLKAGVLSSMAALAHRREDMTAACGHWQNALTIYTALDMQTDAGRITQWMRKAGCDPA